MAIPRKPRVPKPKTSVKGPLDPARCEALSKSTGKQCGNPKGFRTDHPGEGKCRQHGGATPIQHGRYSQIKGRNRFRQLVEKFTNDPNPLDMLPELAIARAVLTDYVESHETWREMLMTWHESYTGKFRSEMRELQKLMKARDPQKLAAGLMRIEMILDEMPPKPNKIMELLEAVKALRTISDLVDKITAVEERKQIPLSAVVDLQKKMSLVMGRELGKRLKGKKLHEAINDIAAGWDQIQVET